MTCSLPLILYNWIKSPYISLNSRSLFRVAFHPLYIHCVHITLFIKKKKIENTILTAQIQFIEQVGLTGAVQTVQKHSCTGPHYLQDYRTNAVYKGQYRQYNRNLAQTWKLKTFMKTQTTLSFIKPGFVRCWKG